MGHAHVRGHVGVRGGQGHEIVRGPHSGRISVRGGEHCQGIVRGGKHCQGIVRGCKHCTVAVLGSIAAGSATSGAGP